MNDYEIIEKKNYLAKIDQKELGFSMSPEESKAVYLKKVDAANQSVGNLNDMALTGDDGHVVSSTVAEKKDLAAKEEDKLIQLKKLGKLDDLTSGHPDQEDLDFTAKFDEKTGDLWFEPTDHYYDDDYDINNEDDVYQSGEPSLVEQMMQPFYDAGVVMGKIIAS